MSDPMVRIYLVSVPTTTHADDLLQALVDDLGGNITESVITDEADLNQATIIFDQSLDN